MHTIIDKQLIEFGNYILKQRKEGNISEENQFSVTDADLANFKHEVNLKSGPIYNYDQEALAMSR